MEIQMKRMLILSAILLMIILPATAIESSLDLGVNISYNTADEVIDDDRPSPFSLDRIAIGLEMRANVSNFQIAIAGDISVIDNSSLLFAGIFTMGISVDMFKYLKFGLTTGPKITYYTGSRANGSSGFFNALYNGDFHYRFMFDVLAGPVMKIGVSYTVPTEFNLAEHRFVCLLPQETDFKQGQIALCIQMKVF